MNRAERKAVATTVLELPAPYSQPRTPQSRRDASEEMLSDTSPELRRLSVLARYRLEPDVPLTEQAFERLVGMAARLFSVPTALISFTGEGWQWWGATCGMDRLNLPESGMDATQSLCGVALQSGEPLVIADLAQHELYRHHPLATGGGVRFYASSPITTPEGHTIGTLCLMDTQPHAALTAAEQQTLGDLSRLIMDELELRLLAIEYERQASASELLSARMREALSHAETLQAISALGELGLGLEDLLLQAVALCSTVCDVDLGSLVAIYEDRAFIFPAWHTPRASGLAAVVARGLRRKDCEGVWAAALSGSHTPIFANDYGSQPGAHLAMAQAGVRAQAYIPIGARGEVRFLMVLSRLHSDRPWRPHQRQLITSAARMMRDLAWQRQQQQALAASTAQLDLALDSAPLILFSVDRAGIFRLMRGSGNELLAWQSLVGKTVEEAFEAVPQIIRNVRRAMSGENFNDVVHVGEQIYDVRYLHTQDAHGGPAGALGGALGLGYNVTGLARSEQRATVARREAEALLELAQTVTGDVLDQQVADSALDALLQMLGGGWLTLWSLRNGRYYSVSCRGEIPAALRLTVEREGQEGTPLAAYLAGVGVANRNVYLSGQTLPERLVHGGVGGLAILPLLVIDDQCLVGLAAYGARPWNPAERGLLETACGIFGASLERRHRLTELEHDAGTDALTGVGNRRALDLALRRALEQATEQSSGLSVVSIDLDGLKVVNDLYGHAKGDALLSRFATELRDALPAGGQLFRLGGDEFVAVCPVSGQLDAVSGSHPSDLGWLQEAVEATRRSGFGAAAASAGEAQFPADAGSAPDLLRLSDERLYVEKERRGSGRG